MDSQEAPESADRPTPLLDIATELTSAGRGARSRGVDRKRAFVALNFRVSVLPQCGEAFVVREQRRRRSGGGGIRGQAADPERSKVVAVARARTNVRRFCTAHRLGFMWTLTYRGDGEFDTAKVRRHVGKLVTKVSEEQGGRFPYLWVPELHPDGHGIHVHMAVPFFFDHGLLTELWGRGHVWCTDLRPEGACGFAGAQRAAGYLTKYLGKAFEVAEFGRHRYERAQGFPIVCKTVKCGTYPEGLEYAERLFGQQPSYVWSSADNPTWRGPVVRLLFFADGAPGG